MNDETNNLPGDAARGLRRSGRKWLVPGLIAAGALALASLALPALLTGRDPVLQGRSLAFWLQDLNSMNPAEVDAARRMLGANADRIIPCLVRDVHRSRPSSPLVVEVAGILPRAWGRWLVQRLRPPEQTNRRANAAQALGVLQSDKPEVIEALGRGLQDGDYRVQQASLDALLQLGFPGAARVLQEMPDMHGFLKQAAVAGIGPQNSSARDAVPVLVAEANRVKQVNEAGAYGSALARFGADALPGAFKVLGKGGPASASSPGVIALKQACMDSFRFFRAFLAEIPHQPAPIRRLSVDVLLSVTLYPGYRTTTLAQLADDPDLEVRLAALKSLDQQALEVPVMLSPLMDFLRSSNPRNRADAARALGQMGTAAVSVIPDLERLRNDPSIEVQAAAAAALAAILEARDRVLKPTTSPSDTSAPPL
ncbi:MAG: HEAT repeat domain-containing protein [Verrucomicrobiales bacterium]|nr:HEAT repeat domain-containing protein [Verrucomicrobiales bacterium]